MMLLSLCCLVVCAAGEGVQPVLIRTVDNNLPMKGEVARQFELSRFLPKRRIAFDTDFYYRIPVEGARASYGHLYFLDQGRVDRNLVITCPDEDVFAVFIDHMAQNRDAEIIKKGQLHHLKHRQSGDPRSIATDFAVRYTGELILIGNKNDQMDLKTASRLIDRAIKYDQFDHITAVRFLNRGLPTHIREMEEEEFPAPKKCGGDGLYLADKVVGRKLKATAKLTASQTTLRLDLRVSRDMYLWFMARKMLASKRFVR